MIRFAADFWASKVTWLGIGYVLLNIGDGLIHGRSVHDVATHVFAALATVFLRDTISKLPEQPIDLTLHHDEESVPPHSETPNG